MTFSINYQNAGMTVLSFLKLKLKISASALASLKKDEKGILVNGSHVTVRYVLKENDILSINELDNESNINENIVPANIPVNIIFENNDILIVDKPPYMPTHPSHRHFDDTLGNALARIYKERNIPFVFRPIGRLDGNTSGVSLIAKNALSASYLEYARKNNLIHKKYIAILNGQIKSEGDNNIINANIKRQQESIITRCIADKDDKDSDIAITHWRLLYSNEKISVVEATPITGRTHQLRVHFAHIGHSIIGDNIYGEPSPLISRHALHAYNLSLPIPYGEETRNFSSMPPEDMQSAFEQLTSLSFDIIKTKLNNKD